MQEGNMKTVKIFSITALALTAALTMSACTAATPESITNAAGEIIQKPELSGKLEGTKAQEKLIQTLDYSYGILQEKGYTEVAIGGGGSQTIVTVYDPSTRQVAAYNNAPDIEEKYILDESALTPVVLKNYIKKDVPFVSMDGNIFTIENPDIQYKLIVVVKDGLIVSAKQTLPDMEEINVTMVYKVTEEGRKILSEATPPPVQPETTPAEETPAG